MNYQIRMSPVRLIGPEGEQIGIVPVKEALDRARELGLDLVEVSPTSRPPVCRILDYGRFKYELSKKDKAAKKKQHSFQMKEMRYRPKIDDHDFEFKTRHVREFLESGSKVRTFVIFRGREMAYVELGRKILDRLAQDLASIAIIEAPPKLDGKNMSMVLIPKPEILRKRKQVKEVRPPQPEKRSEVASSEPD
ncbi:MAG TPA: translation initiation factor IF-3 [Candidatus Deferrimicrobium sp.]|nr:translation initiation factor IF-3 [Candidatus Deferrimicrobium sp.]